MSFSIYLILIALTNARAINASASQIFKSEGDLNLALVLQNCKNSTQQTPFVSQSLINSAIWTMQRLNFLDFTPPLNFGLTVFETCTDKDNYKTIFDLFQRHDEEFLVGLISDFDLSPKIRKFCEVLNLRSRNLAKNPKHVIRASVELLSALNWNDNITIAAPDQSIANLFFRAAQNQWICVRDYIIYEDDPAIPVRNLTGILVIFGEHPQLNSFLQNLDETKETLSIIFVPLDGSVLNDLPLNNYVLMPPHAPISLNYKKTVNFLPTPLLFEVANPILSYAQNIWQFIAENCNETSYKLNCLRNKFRETYREPLNPSEIVDLLRIEPLKPNFVYNVFKLENFSQPYSKLFHYNIFSGNLTLIDPERDFGNRTEIACKSGFIGCHYQCKNFVHKGPLGFALDDGPIRIRPESWVFAVLAIALLGVLFCVAILIFFLVCICRRDVLEGNPVLTMLLLITVMLMFCSILPLSLEGTKSVKESICLARALAITLSYASAFSLILSRSILLATASKEIGFMSHVAGPVQSFLCLFIFGVQAALSIQIIGRCGDIFRGYSLVCLLSYNVMLLLLTLCLCPLIFKCQRNYREGKYFAIAASAIFCLWCIWIPCYSLLGDDWKDPILCFGLVSTASVLIGAIFVPRTYLMTIAAARDKITSTLPSLPTASSVMDIYRASTQPVYDCVNVAAINAVTVARAGVTTIQHPDLYSCPNLPEDDDFDVRCDNSVNSDKVTRF